MSVECAFQGSKVFERGGPFTDLYAASSKEAKTDTRIGASGELIAFDFLGKAFPTTPTTAFYDWLYLQALSQNPDLVQSLFGYQGYTDIVFNPARSLNCQARSAALFVALRESVMVESVIHDRDFYLGLVSGIPDGNEREQLKGAVADPKGS